jgi:hypothetical protein
MPSWWARPPAFVECGNNPATLKLFHVSSKYDSRGAFSRAFPGEAWRTVVRRSRGISSELGNLTGQIAQGGIKLILRLPHDDLVKAVGRRGSVGPIRFDENVGSCDVYVRYFIGAGIRVGRDPAAIVRIRSSH